MKKNTPKTCSALYTPKVMEAYKNPHNYGKIKDASGIGKVGNLVCGDVMWLYIKVDEKRRPASAKGFGEAREIIKDIKFETFGCVAAIATSSMVTDLAKGKTIAKALKISKDDIVKKLGGLPSIKYHCSVLAVDALIEAVYDYYLRQGKDFPEGLIEKHKAIQKEKDVADRTFQD